MELVTVGDAFVTNTASGGYAFAVVTHVDPARGVAWGVYQSTERGAWTLPVVAAGKQVLSQIAEEVHVA